MVEFALLAGCTDYEFARPAPDLTVVGEPGLGTASGLVVDTVEPDVPTDTSGDTAPEPVAEIDLDDCEDGYYADYYNLPANHPDVEIDEGDRTGDIPANHDWWDTRYFVFRQNDPGLEFGDEWWPVDTGMPGDPQYFAVHWTAVLDVSTDAIVGFELGSDDDGWAYIDGDLVGALPGIHAVTQTEFIVALRQGQHQLDLYMAERHTSSSGFWFRWLSEEVGIYACPE